MITDAISVLLHLDGAEFGKRSGPGWFVGLPEAPVAGVVAGGAAS